FNLLAERWHEALGVTTGLGIGINAGEVIAGHIGAPNYTSYTIVGDTVNVAARLSQRARAGEALFSRGVKQALETHGIDLPAMPLPPLALRGREAPVEIFCLPVAPRLQVDH
ncbi:MAG: adenylate/guanylate cyclase domain-containing protein, partial [Gammaproteobacteria bacterium]|nr:adenylate/guanylate cyclase domain-containing protein [Gammaproteobacteria bacterium]